MLTNCARKSFVMRLCAWEDTEMWCSHLTSCSSSLSSSEFTTATEKAVTCAASGQSGSLTETS